MKDIGALLADRYVLKEKIDEGGFSLVYKAVDSKTNKTVVVKALKKEYADDQKSLQLFKKEAAIALKLKHKNITRVYDTGNDGDMHYMVMDYIDGKSLKHIIKLNEGLPVKFVVDISKKICLALEYAHSRGVTHCDIKPHNIMIDMDGEPYLMDFGIAGHIDSGTPYLSDTGSVLGSVHYLSPEQAKAEDLDRRTDIYSLGIVMHEMLTGSVPFEGESSIEIALKHVNEDVPDMDEHISRKVPDSLQNIILKATQKDKRHRYRSALLMYRDLDMCFEDDKGNYVKVDRRLRQKQEKKRIKEKKYTLAIFLIIVGVAIVAGVLALVLVNYVGSPEAERMVIVPNVTNETESDAQALIVASSLVPNVTYAFNEDVPEGVVVSQQPQAALEVKEAEIVTIVISSGPPSEIYMPDITGLPLEEAETLLGIEGLSRYEVVEEFSEEIASGHVVKQIPEEGELVFADDVVVITVSAEK